MVTMKRALFLLALALGFALPSFGQSFSDTLTVLSASACPGSVTAGTGVVYNGIPAVGTGLMVLTTPFAPVYQVSATAAASTITFTCEIPCQGRSTFGKGCSAIAGLAFFYGVQTTALTSENAPVCGTVLFPIPAAAETPSAVAFVSAPITAVPVVGSANLATTTAGAFVTQYLSITTPPSLPTAAGNVYQKIFCTTSWGQTAASAEVVNTPGGVAFTTNTIAWLKRHSHDAGVQAMRQNGISGETAELIFAHYLPENPKAKAFIAAYNLKHSNGALATNDSGAGARAHTPTQPALAIRYRQHCVDGKCDPQTAEIEAQQ